MPSQPMRGVYPILVTPFDEEYQIDEDSLRNLVEFNLAAGVHGLGIALGSEIFKFSESEREQLTQIVVDQVSGRVPVVVNSGASGTDLALHYSRMAEANGADAIMLIQVYLRGDQDSHLHSGYLCCACFCQFSTPDR